MKTAKVDEQLRALHLEFASLTASSRRTLEAIFRHPLAHSLEWSDVLALFGKLGKVDEHANNEFVFELAGQRHLMRKPHTKDLTSDAVLELRHFIMRTGFSPERPSEAETLPVPAAPDLMIVVDHHGAKIFQIDLASDEASEHVIRPYDPHNFLHHLAHKDQSRERGQRAPEEPSYYEKIAEAVALGGRIVVVGHAIGNSNAADHLVEFLKAHHHETYYRVVREISADLSAITPPQLLELARQVLLA
jgi:hypothetical protein